MAEFHFLRPVCLWALLPFIGIVFILWRRHYKSGLWRKAIDPVLLPYLIVNDEEGNGGPQPVHLFIIVGVLTILALAGPAWEKQPSPFAEDDAGLMVLLKVSPTMMAADVQPSRLERSIHKLKDILANRTGQSTGLIAYSGSSHLVMPLTEDSRIITTMAAELSPEIMPVQGDALSAALKEAEEMFRRAKIPGSVLVITDTVDASEIENLKAVQTALPIQFLAVGALNAPIEEGIGQAIDVLGAEVTQLTADREDVLEVCGRAITEINDVSTDSETEEWVDRGYSLLPFIMLLGLFWFRKGWRLA